MPHPAPDRRAFLGTALAGTALAASPVRADPPRRLRVAAVYTVLRHRSHAFNILENFFRPYLFRGRVIDPGMDVVSFYADQTAPMGELSLETARRHNVTIYPTIAGALTLGGRDLAVDAVLLIGEHGEYPVNDLGQTEYPRKRFFDEIVAVMQRSGRSVPVFNDKHLSYRWDWAREMYDTARELGIPFLAGSSVPLAERRPALELPAGAEIEDAVSVHGGGVESYDFHGLEVLQSMVEGRRGGETGVARVEFLEGEALWRAARERRWSESLTEAALAAELGRTVPLQEIRGVGAGVLHGILITYRDGLRAAALKVGSGSTRWDFACQLRGDARVHATRFYTGPWGNRNLFQALSHAIQSHFREGRPPYPIERTLLTTGLVEAAVRSRASGRPVETPHLNVSYRAGDWRAFREDGATWRLVTESTPEPTGMNPGAR